MMCGTCRHWHAGYFPYHKRWGLCTHGQFVCQIYAGGMCPDWEQSNADR